MNKHRPIIELSGKDALNFDSVVNSIKEPNELMTKLIKDVYEEGFIENIQLHATALTDAEIKFIQGSQK